MIPLPNFSLGILKRNNKFVEIDIFRLHFSPGDLKSVSYWLYTCTTLSVPFFLHLIGWKQIRVGGSLAKWHPTYFEVRKTAMIRNQYNNVPHPHLILNTTWESEKSQLDTTNKSQEVSPFPFPRRWPQGSNELTRKHDKHKTYVTRMIHKGSTALERPIKILYWRA